MMKNYTRILYVLAAVLLFSGISCQGEHDAPTETGLKLAVSLGTPDSRAEEAGVEALNENRVQTLDVFICKASDGTCVHYQRIAAGWSGTATYTTYLSAAQGDFAVGEEYITVVVANSSHTFDGQGASLSTLKTLTLSALDPDAIQSNFVMDGTSAAQELNRDDFNDIVIPVKLRRAAAKIRLNIQFANGFSIPKGQTGYKKLLRYAPTATLLSDADAFTPTLTDMADYTAWAEGAGAENRVILYTYANDWREEVGNETYVLFRVPLTDGKTTLDENYFVVPVNYRMPGAGNEEKLCRIERNHLYDVTVSIDGWGGKTPEDLTYLKTNYKIVDWSTRVTEVSVENINFLYVKDKQISLPNSTDCSTTFQSSTPGVTIRDVQVNGRDRKASDEVTITPDANVKSGRIVITSKLPGNFIPKVIKFTVENSAGIAEQVTVIQYPALYITSHTSAHTPGGGQEQDNKNMYIMTSLVADFSVLPYPDEFDEAFPAGYKHWAPDKAKGKEHADAVRQGAVLGYPLLNSSGQTIDSGENNRRISPCFMLASQYGTTTGDNYENSQAKCDRYKEKDKDTGVEYTDWRMPTQYELYMIDILQNVKACAVKRILEGRWYWSADDTSGVQFMDPRVGDDSKDFNSKKSAVRCVRDIRK
ncbi:DUF1566 domain-containing protein [Alistipes sp. OttesenSCG-928-L06]|nr:DUF1566 domain-containing protein [Alistipes sp. OttesenSCG-928-L06]